MLNLMSATLNGINSMASDLAFLIFFAVFTLIVVAFAVWMISYSVNKEDTKKVGTMSVSSVVWIVIILGFILRFVFSLMITGFRGLDYAANITTGGMEELYSEVRQIIQGGLSGSVSFNNYPLPLYIFSIFGGILNLFGAYSVTGNIAMQVMFKLPLALCDAAAAYIIYKIASKYNHSLVGLALAIIYSLCPIFFFTSGIWGSTTSIFALLTLLSLYFMVERKFLGLAISYGLALLTSSDALFLLPIFGVFVVYYFIKSIKANRNVMMSFSERFNDNELGLVFRLPLYLVCSIIVLYLVNLPLLESANFFGWFNGLFIKPFTKLDYFSYNSLSIYNLFGKNGAGIAGSFPIWIFSVLFLAISLALVLVIYLSKKNRANLVLISTYLMITLSIYFMDFSELNLVPVLAALLLAYAVVKDKRILKIFCVFALITFVNASAVMISGGFLNSLPYSAFNNSGITTLLSGENTFGLVINLTCSVIAILTHLYTTAVVLDVALGENRRLFNYRGDSFGSAMTEWFAK